MVLWLWPLLLISSLAHPSELKNINKSSLSVKKLRKKYLMNGYEVKNKRQMRCKETQYSMTHYVLQTKKIVLKGARSLLNLYDNSIPCSNRWGFVINEKNYSNPIRRLKICIPFFSMVFSCHRGRSDFCLTRCYRTGVYYLFFPFC